MNSIVSSYARLPELLAYSAQADGSQLFTILNSGMHLPNISHGTLRHSVTDSNLTFG